MDQETLGLVLDYLKEIERKLDDRLVDLRLLDISPAAGWPFHLQVLEVRRNRAIGKFKRRLDRIERRLELADG